MTNRTVEERVSIVEVGLHNLDQRVEHGFKDLGDNLRKLTDTLTNTRPPIPFKEIVITVGACLAILGYVAAVAAFFVDAKVAATRPDTSVIEWRLKQLETTSNGKHDRAPL